METVDAGPVAERVRSLRDALQLTQQQLADLGKLTRDEVSRIEIGRNKCTSGRIRRGLAAGFGLTLEDAFAFIEGRLSVEDAKRRAKPPKKAVTPLKGGA